MAGVCIWARYCMGLQMYRGYVNESGSKLTRGRCIPAVLNLAEKLPFMDSRVIRSRSAVCMFCPASGEVGVMVPEEAAFAAS